MLIVGICLIGLAVCLFLLGAYAAGMSDVPGASSGVGGVCVVILLVGIVFIVLWASGFHFAPLIVKGGG